MGVNTFRFKLWAFVIGAAIGGLSGALYAGQVQFVAPTNFNIINSMLFLCAVVLGGQGNKLGVIFGAFIIVYLPNRLLGVRVPRHQPRRPEVPVLRPRAGGADDLPARRACSRCASSCWPTAKPARDLLRSAADRRSRRHDVADARSPRRSSRNWPACTARSTPPRAKSCCETKDLTVKFGGLTALDAVTLRHPPRRDPRPDRAQRRRQDHLLQRDHRCLPADLGLGDRSTAQPLGQHQAAPDHPAAASPAPSRTSGCSAR